MSSSLILTIGFCGLGAALFALLLFNLHRAVKERAKQASHQLETRGYVVDTAYLRPLGTITRIWGRFSIPVGLYAQASNLDPIAIAAGHLGIADIKLGHPEFDSYFVVRSNQPELVGHVFDASMRAQLLRHENIRFRTGSIDSLLGADYFPEQNARSLRNFWMIEKAGNLDEKEASQLLALGQSLAERAARHGAGKDTHTGTFEGR